MEKNLEEKGEKMLAESMRQSESLVKRSEGNL